MRVFAVVVMAVIGSLPVSAGDLYVDPVAGLDSNDGSLGSPFQTIQAAVDAAQAGDSVLLQSGVYNSRRSVSTNSDFQTIVELKRTHRGTLGNPITIKNAPGARPVLELTADHNHAFYGNGASHFVIEGLEMVGNSRFLRSMSVADVRSTYDKRDPIRDNSGIWIYGFAGFAPSAENSGTDITIRDNTIRDFGNSGIRIGRTDVITIEGNRIHDNAEYSEEGGSGISIGGDLYDSVDSVNPSEPRIVVRENVIHNNRNLMPFTTFGGSTITDGNGIILDNIDGYDDPIRIENNVIFGNGGAGIQAFNYVTEGIVEAINNTTVNNGDGVQADKANLDFRGEFVEAIVKNNISVAGFGDSLLIIDGGLVNATVENNLLWAPGTISSLQIRGSSLSDLLLDPLFVDALGNDYRLDPLSPAIDAGVLTDAPAFDILGVARPSGSAVDIGAFETAIPEPAAGLLLILALPLLMRRSTDDDSVR
ncbi:MAG: right-handed parallel beta-helix repeat-containing protein [Planctomycetota bacterium]